MSTNCELHLFAQKPRQKLMSSLFHSHLRERNTVPSSQMSETKRVMGCHYKKVLILSVTTWMIEEKPLNPTSESFLNKNYPLLLCFLKAKIKLIITTNSLWLLNSPVKLAYVFTPEYGNTPGL